MDTSLFFDLRVLTRRRRRTEDVVKQTTLEASGDKILSRYILKRMYMLTVDAPCCKGRISTFFAEQKVRPSSWRVHQPASRSIRACAAVVDELNCCPPSSALLVASGGRFIARHEAPTSFLPL
jgi:hypothetical protein